MNLYIFNEKRAVYGVGTYIREMTGLLRHSHINICVVHLMSDKPQIQTEETDNIKHLYLPAPVSNRQNIDHNELYFCNVVYLLQWYIEDKKELVFHLNYNQSGRLAEELKKKFDCRIVSVVHGFIWCSILSGNITRFRKILASEDKNHQDDGTKTAVIEWYRKERALFEIADHVICLSENTRLILQDDYKIKPDKITVIYNGLTDNNSIMDKQTLRLKYHVPDVPIVLFAGRLNDKKGLVYALRAFKVILAIYPDCHFIIAGSGSFDIHMKECEDIWFHITWTGMVNKTVLYELYSIADIGVLPSLTEQCSYVAIEMMMHGLPVIITATSGLTEMAEDGISCLQVPVIERNEYEVDSSLLAERLLFLLQNPDKREQMGKNARRRYEAVFSAKMFRKNMLHFYHSILNKRHYEK